MHTIRRSTGVPVAVVGMIAAAALFATPAYGAAPYTTDANVTTSNSNPDEGGSFTVSGTDFGSNEDVSVDLHSVVRHLATEKTDANGAFSVSVTLLASDAPCAHEVVATGAESGRTAALKIYIGPNCDGAGNTASNLPRTGAIALAGLGVIGLGLLGGGLVLVSKRRKVDA